ncbi:MULTISPECIES: conjugal transfer protein TraG N-terminal domain-containing protein [Gammaproteobacteria]|jgi:type IV secretory system conjugative DNA transfer VirD4/TraG family protein|uniref:conjugal transfer protein TraG N-terminal domain-containing protein n=1 Tax=Alloalcanivorax xenomutans TaxID=1094342 RepID=UPI000C42FC84|nr:conjugal transfer protein TraG N-terminal domain-containing protein [Alloalcanivorax xenomutans]MAO58784.1 conjugal transfer protein TraG [Alcanivorax sp.]MAY11599.1 conjugal transfer protein TraG [Alcanivorax sp.]MCE7522063.1 conjugal transfer protein TraG N-terminal domain-containing protein [Alloalcanivorax xenomutans]|tara:strand:+ start:131 stop:1648 length:1518 start_codon:yes stop_codon:yes gene_type:complete
MTLYTSDYLEYYLTLVAWIINNGIWDVLVASGIFALPFLAIVVQEWLKARAEGADEGNKGVLSSMRIENRVWVAIVVILFAGIPFIPVDLGTLQFDRSRSQQCQVNVPEPSETNWSTSFTTLNNQSAHVPVWWFFMHAISKAVTGAAVAAIPCGTDLRQMRMDIDSTRIADPLLAQEVADFTRDCYGPARAKLFTNRPTLSNAEMHDVTWVGSRFFLNTTGFYDTYRSQSPRDAWPYNDSRDAGLAEVASGGGYPNCRQWWLDSGDGLRDRLLAQVDPDLLTRLGQWAGFLSQTEVDDSVIRAIASPQHQVMNQGHVYTDYGGQIGVTLPNVTTRVASDLGLTVGSLGFFPAMDVVRQALPMVLSFLKMAMVICIPLLLIFGTYNLQTVVTMTAVQFALFFVDFWFQLARWVDSTILNALYGWQSPHVNFNPLFGLNNAFGDMLLNFVMAMMFIVLPGFWVIALSWAGIRVGNVLGGLTLATGDAKSAGGSGAGIAMKAATKGAK